MRKGILEGSLPFRYLARLLRFSPPERLVKSQPRRLRPSLGPVVISLAAGAVVLLSGVLVNGCRISKLLGSTSNAGGGRGGGVISVTPREVHDSAIAGASIMRVANLAVSNAAGWAATSGDPWIHITSTNSGSRGTVRLSLDPQNLEPGLHEGIVTVQERDSEGGRVSVPVNFLIQQPVLDVQPGDLAFTWRSTNVVFHDTLYITNEGTGPLVWAATTEHQSSWLALSDTAGTAPATIAVRASNEGLSFFGTFKETIIITAPGAKNSPTRIEVTMKRRRHGD